MGLERDRWEVGMRENSMERVEGQGVHHFSWLGSQRTPSQICEKYKDGLLWPRRGSAPSDSAETRWKQILKEIKPSCGVVAARLNSVNP